MNYLSEAFKGPRFFCSVSFFLLFFISHSQETFTAQNNAGLDLWIDAGDWVADVGANRRPDCTNEPVTIIIPAGVTTVFRNYPGDIAEFTCEVHLEIYGTLSFRNNDGDPTGIWLNNPNSTVFIDENATLDTTTPGGGDPNQNYLQIHNTVLWNGGTDGDFVEGTTGGMTYSEFVPLPVELVAFEVNASPEGPAITWSTASELNNSHFTVLRSSDGIQFEEIATVEGSGTTSSFKSYAYVDRNPLLGLSYYQLKQTDYDGSYEYFSIVAYRNEEFLNANISIFPNPTKGVIHIKGDANQIFDASIKDLSGREILATQQLSLAETERFFNGQVSSLKKGVYFIHFKSVSHQSFIRLVVD